MSYNSAFCISDRVNFLQFLYIQLKICILNVLFELNKCCGPANFTYNTLIFVILLTTFIAIILLPFIAVILLPFIAVILLPFIAVILLPFIAVILLPFIAVILLPFIAVITTFISVILLPNYNTFSFKVVIGCNHYSLDTK